MKGSPGRKARRQAQRDAIAKRRASVIKAELQDKENQHRGKEEE